MPYYNPAGFTLNSRVFSTTPVLNPITLRMRSHLGQDWNLAPGTTDRGVPAADNGTVWYRGYDATGYGNYVVIQHALPDTTGVYYTVYAHLADPGPIAGTPVRQGGVIGQMGTTGGSSGLHLHFEVVTGSAVVPLGDNPLQSGVSRVDPNQWGAFSGWTTVTTVTVPEPQQDGQPFPPPNRLGAADLANVADASGWRTTVS
jgi:murein DD-endopeptidase MepM/ murein hydrolase activator NlpD